MKIPTFIRRKKKKLRASTARRSLGVPDEMDYEEMSEPNMKLSRALLIVLVLHIVAVAGIIAFNSIKTRQGPLPPPALSKTISAPARDIPPVEQTATAKTTEPALAQRDAEKPSHARASGPAKEEHKTERAKSATKNAIADSGKTYVVAKGDNPVTIARKFKVSYDALLALNHIDDPRKLQIGQKLLIPAKTAKSKKED